MQKYFDIYGLRFAVGGDWPEVVEDVRLDFAWFERPEGGTVDLEVEIRRLPPDYAQFGDLPAAFVTPRNTVYQDDSRTIVDYFGRALSVLDRARGRFLIEGEDVHLVHEAAYHFLLSSVGAHLDRIRLTRLHALGLSVPSGGVALMLPSGGGKSTMAVRALQDDGVKLLSEDTPLIDWRGALHPFPLRIALNPPDASKLPPDRMRRMDRMEVHPKFLLDLEAFGDSIEGAPRPLRHLVIGRRTLGSKARLDPAPRGAAASTLFSHAVLGVRVYQGMEWVLQRGPRDVLGLGGTAARRARSCAAVLARARTWTLTMGRDKEENWDALQPILRGEV